MMRHFRVVALGLYSIAGWIAAANAQIRAGADSGFGTFQEVCMKCHGKANMPNAPAPAAMREFSPEKLYQTLTTAPPNVHAALSLTDEQKRRAAEAIAYRLIGTAESGEAKLMPNQCANNPPLPNPSAGPGWNGWGADGANTRFQPPMAAGITPDQVPRLKLKWAFGFPGGASAYGQPTLVSGRVFVGADTGHIYSLDAATGCVYWSFRTKASVRNAMTIGPVSGHGSSKYAVFFGDLKSNVYGLDAQNGELLWTAHVEENYTARITAAPALHNGRLYVPMSKWEANAARTLDYPCCTVRGSIVALDANTGRQIWKHYTIEEEPKPVRKNSIGTELWAPAGASVWNTPTVDAKRRAIYFGTGDASTEPAAKTTDAVMAMDMDTGKILWSYQSLANDVYILGCTGPTRTENCPSVVGPDLDIGSSAILKTLEGGKRVLLGATKGGEVFGLDPDHNGALLWKVNVAPNPGSGIVWGGAADDKTAYFGLSGGGVAAVKLASGERIWFNSLQSKSGGGNRNGNQAAATAINGVVFIGGRDGMLHALSSGDGHILWEFDSARDFETVNKVPAHGGSIVAPGVTIAGGMMFVGSGYFVFGDKPGNVLLAFSPQ